MELTHRLKIRTGSHIVHHEEWDDAINFTYTPSEYIHWAEFRSTSWWLYHYRTDGGWEKKILSDPQTLTPGIYKANVNNPGHKLIIFYAETYAENEVIQKIGEYEDGDRFEITTAGVYILMENDYEGTDDLRYSVQKFIREYDEEVIDYETTTIEEPIGFDDLKMTIKRHDYHGMGAEVSLGNLEFYGNAIGIIESAYSSGIDSEVIYEVFAGSDVIYRGQLDLSTYSTKLGDYKSISVKVGEIGAKTTFNNRTDKEVDVDDPKTIDGNAVTAPDWLTLEVPSKHLLYTNYATQSSNTSTGTFEVTKRLKRNVFIPIGNNWITEFGSVTNPNAYAIENVSEASPQYIAGNDHVSRYGQNTQMLLQIRLLATMTFDPVPYGGMVSYQIIARDSGGTVITSQVYNSNYPLEIDAWLSGYLSASGTVKYYIRLTFNDPSAVEVSYNANVTVKKGSYVKMKMLDNLTNNKSETKMILVKDALNVVSHAISENALDVKSDWYEYASTPGGGALKALTNGYKIRDLYTDGINKRNMPISFKDLIQSLDALDCVGWGFSRESNVDYVRVERWDWFYKSDVVLTLKNVAEIQVDVDPDRIPTELQIGYKKYATQDQYNSIDSPHGVRDFINSIKAVSKKITQECDFIADNYAIEETRRARKDMSETEESTYDENIFVFELVKVGDYYDIGHTALNAENVGNTDEFINAKLTPRHMAARWADYIFATNNTTPFRFTTGEINYQATFAVIPEYWTDGMLDVYSLRPFVADPSVAQAENADIAYTHAKFQAEKITFSYPLSIAEYKSVLANPYGLIRLTDNDDNVIKEGWILDFKYKLEDGMADFTLIAKY